MKNLLLLLILPGFVFAQISQPLDSIFYIDGKIDEVKIISLNDLEVKFRYPEESFEINCDLKKIQKIKTSKGRVFESKIENTFCYVL